MFRDKQGWQVCFVPRCIKIRCHNFSAQDKGAMYWWEQVIDYNDLVSYITAKLLETCDYKLTKLRVRSWTRPYVKRQWENRHELLGDEVVNALIEEGEQLADDLGGKGAWYDRSFRYNQENIVMAKSVVTYMIERWAEAWPLFYAGCITRFDLAVLVRIPIADTHRLEDVIRKQTVWWAYSGKAAPKGWKPPGKYWGILRVPTKDRRPKW